MFKKPSLKPHSHPPEDTAQDIGINEPDETQVDENTPSTQEEAEDLSDSFRHRPYIVEEVSDEMVRDEAPEPELEEDTSVTRSFSPDESYTNEPQLESQPEYSSNENQENWPTSPRQDYLDETPSSPPHSTAPSSRDYFQFPHQPTSNFKLPWPIIAIVLGIIVIVGIIIKIITTKSSSPLPKANEILIEGSSAQTSPTPSPEATETEINCEETKLQVLNGSGVTGAAGKLAKILDTAGFTDIKIGNADNFDVKGVKIQVKDGEAELGKLIEEDLADDYEDIVVKETLDEDSDFDAVITLGKQASDASPTPSPSSSGSVQGASTSADLKQSSDKTTTTSD